MCSDILKKYVNNVRRCVMEHGTINNKSMMLLGQLNPVAVLARTRM
jgi:hypothetical protein